MEINYKPQPHNFTYIWYCIHSIAIRCKTQQSKIEFANFMDGLAKTLPCSKCRKHLKGHIETSHVSEYFEKEDGCFYWSWDLHNKVNKTLDKKHVEYKDAYDFYINLENFGCDLKDCADEPQNTKHEHKINNFNRSKF